MAFTYFEIGISLIILLFHFFILYALLKLKISLIEDFSEAIVYFRVSVFVLIALRIQAIFSRAGLLNMLYLQDILALVLAIFLFLAFHSFYKSVVLVSGKKRKKGRLI
ncbi:hypothetical protein HY449_03340 [Candidatus Pacearchaeota archaeon]|nr:hypothetical protein [Candidatus Pacearchaeota archaeon]